MKIIETSANQLYRVWDNPSPELAYCWTGVAVKRAAGGTFADKKNGRPELVRKAACRIVQETGVNLDPKTNAEALDVLR